MIFIPAESLDCNGIDFTIAFEVFGSEGKTRNDPDHSLECHFHRLMVHLKSDYNWETVSEKEAQACIGKDVFEMAQNLAVAIYLEPSVDIDYWTEDHP